MLSAIALVASLGAHWVNWDFPGHHFIQKGVAIGTPRVDERLILFSKDGTCKGFIRYAGKHGDLPQAKRFLDREMGCHLSRQQLRIHKAKG